MVHFIGPNHDGKRSDVQDDSYTVECTTECTAECTMQCTM